MNTNTTLRSAIVNFAFTGVMGPHRRPIGYEAPRVVSQAATKRN